MSSFFNGVFSDFLLEGKLCDTVIRAGDAEFKVHRIVLCSCSSYFRDLFCSQPASPDQVHVLPHLTPQVLVLVLEFAYTGSVQVTEENVSELLAAADLLRVRGLVRVCCRFLEGRLCPASCLHIWTLAGVHGCPELRRDARRHVLLHFPEVARSADFLQLSAEQLEDFLRSDELNVRDESHAFEAVLRWIQHQPEERGRHMAPLLSQVRLALMPIDFLVDSVSRTPLVRSSLPCLAQVIDAMKTLRESPDSPARVRVRPPTRTRLPPAVLLAAGDHPRSRVELYDVRADRWLTANRDAARRVFHSCVALDDFLYVIGGFDGADFLRSARRLRLATGAWEEVGSMHAARCYVSAAALRGCVFAIGGSNADEVLRSAERYEPRANQWSLTRPMAQARCDAGAAALRGKVYVCGGFCWDEPLSSAEVYDPDSDQWTLIAPMPAGRSAAGVVAYRDQIYVVGGHSGVRHMCSVFSFDPSSGSWRTASPMTSCRCNLGVAVLEERLYAVGGFDSRGAVVKVERYDGRDDRWTRVRDLEGPLGTISCCVVPRDPHALAHLS